MATVAEVVDTLVTIYEEHPQGITRGTEAADQVYALGKAIHEAGGMELMLFVHDQFKARDPRHARNLEMRWNGIGMWMG